MKQLKNYQVKDPVLQELAKFGVLSTLEEQSEFVKTCDEVGLPLHAMEQAVYGGCGSA